MFFMHLKDHPKLIKVTFGAAFFFFLILVAHTLSDYLSRDQMGMPTFPASGLVSKPVAVPRSRRDQRTSRVRWDSAFSFCFPCTRGVVYNRRPWRTPAAEEVS